MYRSRMVTTTYSFRCRIDFEKSYNICRVDMTNSNFSMTTAIDHGWGGRKPVMSWRSIDKRLKFRLTWNMLTSVANRVTFDDLGYLLLGAHKPVFHLFLYSVQLCYVITWFRRTAYWADVGSNLKQILSLTAKFLYLWPIIYFFFLNRVQLKRSDPVFMLSLALLWIYAINGTTCASFGSGMLLLYRLYCLSVEANTDGCVFAEIRWGSTDVSILCGNF